MGFLDVIHYNTDWGMLASVARVCWDGDDDGNEGLGFFFSFLFFFFLIDDNSWILVM